MKDLCSKMMSDSTWHDRHTSLGSSAWSALSGCRACFPGLQPLIESTGSPYDVLHSSQMDGPSLGSWPEPTVRPTGGRPEPRKALVYGSGRTGACHAAGLVDQLFLNGALKTWPFQEPKAVNRFPKTAFLLMFLVTRGKNGRNHQQRLLRV